MFNEKKSRMAGKKLSSKEMKQCKGGLSAGVVANGGCPTNPVYCCYIVNSPFGQMAVMAACTTAADGRCMCGPTDACPI